MDSINTNKKDKDHATMVMLKIVIAKKSNPMWMVETAYEELERMSEDYK